MVEGQRTERVQVPGFWGTQKGFCCGTVVRAVRSARVLSLGSVVRGVERTEAARRRVEVVVKNCILRDVLVFCCFGMLVSFQRYSDF